jgi:plastocyanin
MEPVQPQSQFQSTPPQKSHVKPLFIVGVVVAALVAIAISVFVIMNPRGIETNATETTSEVMITERGITPPTVTVKKGSNITWKNQDTAEHKLQLTSLNPPAELEGFGLTEGLASGEEYTFTFEAAGTFTYNDPTSPELVQGTIIVEE